MLTVAIDFDNTLHPYTRGWLGTGVVDSEPPHEDVEYFLSSLVAAGLRVVVHSCRAESEEGKSAIGKWLRDTRLARYVSEITHEKPAAIVYLDDRGLRFEGDWFAARDAILRIALETEVKRAQA